MYNNKKILVLGLAKSGYEVCKVLSKLNCDITLNDININQDENIINDLKKRNIKIILGEHPDDLLDTSFSYVIKNPGIKIDHKYVLKAKELGIPVINEMEVGYNLIREKANVTIIGITGTNGKTTTTTLIYEILKEKYPNNVHLCGNIGFPLCSFVEKVKDKDILVIETSCQQLENLVNYKPDIAVLTNITKAHLEFMKTYEHYKYVKGKIFQNQTKSDVLIVNNNDTNSKELVKTAKSKIKYFGIDTYIKDNYIYYLNNQVISLNDIILRGNHNYENIMASIMVCKELNVEDEIIRKVLKTFKGVEHRLEFVRKVNDRIFYNDTEATNIKCTQIALSSFNEKIIVILGGYERGQDFNDLKDYLTNVKAILAIGETKDRVEKFALDNNILCYKYEHLKDAVIKGYEISSPNDIILLSPASASWDQYKKCEDRGDEFKKIVNTLE